MDSSSAGKLPPSSPLSAAKGAAGAAVGSTVVASGQAVGATSGPASVRPDGRERSGRRAGSAGSDGQRSDDAAGDARPTPSDLPPIDHAGWLTLAEIPRMDATTAPPSGSDIRRAYHLDEDEPGAPSISRTA